MEIQENQKKQADTMSHNEHYASLLLEFQRKYTHISIICQTFYFLNPDKIPQKQNNFFFFFTNPIDIQPSSKKNRLFGKVFRADSLTLKAKCSIL